MEHLVVCVGKKIEPRGMLQISLNLKRSTILQIGVMGLEVVGFKKRLLSHSG